MVEGSMWRIERVFVTWMDLRCLRFTSLRRSVRVWCSVGVRPGVRVTSSWGVMLEG